MEHMPNLAAQIHDRAPELAIGQVNPDQMSGLINYAEEDGRFAASGRPVTYFLHQALLDQIGHDAGDSGARQAGIARDIRAADPAMVVDGLEHQLTVVSFGLLVSGFLQPRLHSAYI